MTVQCIVYRAWTKPSLVVWDKYILLLGKLLFNPLSPNIHLEILRTDLYMFHWKTSWENLLKDQCVFLKVIILVILITFSLHYVLIVWGENWCWSLLSKGPGKSSSNKIINWGSIHMVPDKFSTSWKFVWLGTLFTEDHANRTKIGMATTIQKFEH